MPSCSGTMLIASTKVIGVLTCKALLALMKVRLAVCSRASSFSLFVAETNSANDVLSPSMAVLLFPTLVFVLSKAVLTLPIASDNVVDDCSKFSTRVVRAFTPSCAVPAASSALLATLPAEANNVVILPIASMRSLRSVLTNVESSCRSCEMKLGVTTPDVSALSTGIGIRVTVPCSPSLPGMEKTISTPVLVAKTVTLSDVSVCPSPCTISTRRRPTRSAVFIPCCDSSRITVACSSKFCMFNHLFKKEDRANLLVPYVQKKDT